MTRSSSAFAEAVVLAAAFAAALLVSPISGRTVAGVGAVGAALLIAALSVLYGRAVGWLLGVPPGASYRNAFEVVAGFAGVSLIHQATTAVLNLTAMRVLPIDVFIGGALFVASLRRERSGSVQAGTPWRAAIGIDVCVFLMCGALVALWGRETISSIRNAEATGVFRAWQDYFLHASEITYIRDYPAFGRHAQYLSGAPQPLYHRASYAMSALFSAVGGVPSLETATTFWMPAGLLLCMLATYALGCALGTRLSGLASVAAVFLFPDASTYVWKNQFLGFAWLMQVAPGSGYAVALVLLALIVSLADGWREGTRFPVAFVLVGAAAPFRAHISAIAGGMLLLASGFAWRPAFTRRGLGILVLSIAAAAGAVLFMESLTLAPHFLTGHSHPMQFLQLVHSMAEVPTRYSALTAGRSDIVAFAIGYAMLIVCVLGIMIPALLVVLLGGALGEAGQRAARFTLALVLAHIAVILFVPTAAHGDLSEFAHRPFVLIYAVISALVGAGIGRQLTSWSMRSYGSESPGLVTLVGLMIVGCLVPLTMGPGLQQRWGPHLARVPVRSEEFDAGRWVRRRSTQGEHVLVADNDPLAVFVGLTERVAFLSRLDLYQRFGGSIAELAAERAAANAGLAPVTFEELQTFGRSHGVQWYVANTPSSQQWPSAVIQHCAYCGGAVQVYDLR